MSAITIYIAPGNQRSLLSALIDLSASGHVLPFAWWEPGDDPERAVDRQNPELLYVANGRVHRTNLHTLDTQIGVRTLRLQLIVPIGSPEYQALPVAAEIYLHDIRFSTGIDVHYTRILVPYGDNCDPHATGRAGWHDFMVSPESTKAPQHTAVPWWTQPQEIPGACAFALAMYGGIIAANPVSPLDSLPDDVSDDVIVTRHFYREADMSQIEEELRQAVLDINVPPVPRRLDQGQVIQPFPDPLQWSAYLADKWAENSSGLLLTERQQLPQNASERIGAWQVLKAFFSFLFTSLIGAPGRWLDRMILKTKAAIAGTVSRVVFGDAQPVNVLVAGVDAQGRPVQLEDLRLAASTLRDSLQQAGLTPPVSHERSLASLWTDFHNGICAMLDGSGNASLGLTTGDYYMNDWNAVVPLDPQQSTFTIEHHSQFVPSGTRIECWQAMEAAAVVEALEKAATHEPQAMAKRQQDALRLTQWQQENSLRFIPRIGMHLADISKRLRSEREYYLQAIQQLTQESSEQDFKNKQRKLARLMRILVAVLGLGIGAIALIYFFGWMSTMIMFIVSLVWLLIWLISTIIAFYRGQREVFAMLMTRSTSDDTLRVYTENLARVLDDTEALATAQRQLDHWASLMREFLRDPLHSMKEDHADNTKADNLPKGMRVEKMTAPQDAINKAAAHLRAQIFTQGWVTRAWEATEAAKVEFFSPDQVHINKNLPFVMEADTCTESSPLNRWVVGVCTQGMNSNFGTHVWEYCRDVLAKAEPNFLGINPTPEGVSFQEFVNGFNRSDSGSVYREILKASARSDNKALTQPNQRFVHMSENGLSRSVILMDQTQSLMASDFVFSEQRTEVHSPMMDEVVAPAIPEPPYRF